MIGKLTIDRLDLRPKLILAFVFVALLVALTGAVGFTAVMAVDDQAHRIAEDGHKMDAAAESEVALKHQEEAIQNARLGEGDARQQFEDASETFDEETQRLADAELSPEQQERVDTIRALHEEYNELGQEFFEARAAGDDALAERNAEEMAALETEMADLAHSIEVSARTDLDNQIVAADDTTRNAQIGLVGLTVISFVAAISIGLFVARRITTPVTQLSDAAVAASNGDLDADIDDHVEDDELGRMVTAFKEMQTNLHGIFAELEAVGRGLEHGELERDLETDFPGTYGELMRTLDSATDQLTASFEEIREASENLEQGALDRSIDTDQPGAYGDVLADLEGGIGQLNDSLGTVREIADQVATSSEEAASNAEEIERASEEVAGSVEEISHGAETQSENLGEVASEMNEMSATVEEIAASAEEVAQTAETAVERSNAGQAYAMDATSEIEAIETQADETVTQVEALDGKMDEIGEIVEMITEIAEQTNILALNASIEAARAGEAGDGFGVVASEIKSLAEEVADATTDIERRIGEVQSTTSEAVEGMETMSDRVEEGAETIEDAIEMFDDIAEAVGEAESGIQEISDATDDQAASSEEIVSMVDEVSSASEQAAAEAGNVSAATEEQTASLSDVSQNIQHLSTLSGDLHTQLSTFDIREDVAAERSGSAGDTTSSVRAQADGGFTWGEGDDSIAGDDNAR